MNDLASQGGLCPVESVGYSLMLGII